MKGNDGSTFVLQALLAEVNRIAFQSFRQCANKGADFRAYSDNLPWRGSLQIAYRGGEAGGAEMQLNIIPIKEDGLVLRVFQNRNQETQLRLISSFHASRGGRAFSYIYFLSVASKFGLSHELATEFNAGYSFSCFHSPLRATSVWPFHKLLLWQGELQENNAFWMAAAYIHGVMVAGLALQLRGTHQLPSRIKNRIWYGTSLAFEDPDDCITALSFILVNALKGFPVLRHKPLSH